MSQRYIEKVAGTAGMQILPNASPIRFNKTSQQVVVKDDSGTVRELVTADGAQSLTNKTIRETVTDYATDGAIAIASGIATLSKGSAGAYTLAAPTAAQEGTRLTITSRSAFAHVVTATDLIEDGVTGGAKDTATFAAFVGASMELIAINLKWHTVSLKAVTVAAV